MVLLSKVVQKLAIIADLQTARAVPDETEDQFDHWERKGYRKPDEGCVVSKSKRVY